MQLATLDLEKSISEQDQDVCELESLNKEHK